MRLGIVADDLTGAMDTGVQFAKSGVHTLVVLAEGDLPPAEAVVISTDSRNEPASIAYRRVKEVAERLRDRAVYKKIDSTLRGNLGSELDGLLDGLGLEHALVAPAFPAIGRTTEDGFHRVNGTLISESPFARDPYWPISEPHLPTLLRRQTRRSVGHMPLAIVDRGEESVREALAAEDASIVTADAVEPTHLRNLAMAVASLRERWIPCGSAGLAEEWPRALGLGQIVRLLDSCPDPKPVLVVAGSRHPSTAQQLRRAVREGCLELVQLPAEGRWTADSIDKAASLLQQGRSVALVTTFSEYQEGLGAAMAAALARAAGEVARLAPISGIFMAGGDVARALCSELGATALRVLDEVQAGIPAGLLVGGPLDGVRVVTKAGGFGDELAIVKSIQCLQGRKP